MAKENKETESKLRKKYHLVVYNNETYEEKAMQRALLQYTRPENYELVRKALIKAGREDLIGTAPECLIREKTERRYIKNDVTGRKKSISKNKGGSSKGSSSSHRERNKTGARGNTRRK